MSPAPYFSRPISTEPRVRRVVRRQFSKAKKQMACGTNCPLPSSDHSSPFGSDTSSKNGRLQYWVDMLNGPGFYVEILGPPGDDRRHHDPVNVSPSRHGYQSSATTSLGKSHLASLDAFREWLDIPELSSGFPREEVSANRPDPSPWTQPCRKQTIFAPHRLIKYGPVLASFS